MKVFKLNLRGKRQHQKLVSLSKNYKHVTHVYLSLCKLNATLLYT